MSTLWYYSGRYLLTNVLFFLQFIIILCHLLPLPIYFAAHATEQNLNRHFSFLPNAKRKKPNDLLNVTKWRGSHNHIYTYKTWILYVCVCVCSRFPKPPKVPGSWNFGSRPNLGQLKTWRSPIFEILIFTDSMGIFRVF